MNHTLIKLLSETKSGDIVRRKYACPCGGGTIEEEQDYTPGHRDGFAFLNCKKCSCHYKVDFGTSETHWTLVKKGKRKMPTEINDFFYTQECVDRHFASGAPIDHEKISTQYVTDIHQNMDDARFERLLIVSGFIPDLYANDSSEETLYTKLVEGLVSEWARRIGATGDLIKQKASYEDIRITLAGKIVVCDAKSFRLGRSQQAPNAKDFLKLEDIRKWKDRYPTSIGGLVTYPCKHEWATKSDIYQYCSTKDAPTVMLPYKYLAYLLHYKSNYTPEDFASLWDYETLFPVKFSKDIPGGNKVKYWKTINAAICRITKTTLEQLSAYMVSANKLINECVAANLAIICRIRQSIIERISNSISEDQDIESIKKRLIEYQINTETDLLNKIIQRIKEFR